MRILFILLGGLLTAIGVVGLFLPLIPTMPFLIAAAYLFARSSKRLHDWLTTHPSFGPQIDDWNRHGAIRRSAKWYTTGSIIVAFGLSFLFDVHPFLVTFQGVTLVGVALWVWARPEPR